MPPGGTNSPIRTVSSITQRRRRASSASRAWSTPSTRPDAGRRRPRPAAGSRSSAGLPERAGTAAGRAAGGGSQDAATAALVSLATAEITSTTWSSSIMLAT